MKTDDLFEKVRSIPIVKILQVFFPGIVLRRDGRNLAALCPIHPEKTASFKINVEKNVWKCFCSASCVGGSVIDLLLKASLASSPLEAAKMIAERFWIETGKEKKPGRQQVLTLPEYAAYVNLPQDFLSKTFHIREIPKGLEMPYL